MSPREPLRIQGTVEEGIGRAAYIMEGVPDHVWRRELGFKPARGTLNVRVGEEARRELRERADLRGPVLGRWPEYVRLIILHPKGARSCLGRFSRDKGTVEIVAEEHLRTALEIEDGDTVTLEAP